jgi:hypothetical protein
MFPLRFQVLLIENLFHCKGIPISNYRTKMDASGGFD